MANETIRLILSDDEDCDLEEFTSKYSLKRGPLFPFSEKTIEFLEAISNRITSDPLISSDPEMSALAFWLRKKHVESLSNTQTGKAPEYLTHPKGVVFLIPPKNVATHFLYQLSLSLLVGNKTIIRIPKDPPEHTLILCEILKSLLCREEYQELKKNLLLLSYGHDKEITQYLSSVCDLRVIWGSDETVQAIRQIPLAPGAADVSFANKYSWMTINAARFMELSDKGLSHFLLNFKNDIFLFDQNACSSPKTLCWIGQPEEISKAAKKLTYDFQKLGESFTKLPLGNVIEKRDLEYALLAVNPDSQLLESNPNYSRIWLKNSSSEIHQNIRRLHSGNRTIVEMGLPQIADVLPLLTPQDQTLCHFGFDKSDILQLAHSKHFRTFDRIVPLGQANQFTTSWDGYNLLKMYQKEVLFHS